MCVMLYLYNKYLLEKAHWLKCFWINHSLHTQRDFLFELQECALFMRQIICFEQECPFFLILNMDFTYWVYFKRNRPILMSNRSFWHNILTHLKYLFAKQLRTLHSVLYSWFKKNFKWYCMKKITECQVKNML